MNRRQAFFDRLGLPDLTGFGGFFFGLSIDSIGSGLYASFLLLYFHEVAGIPLARVGVAMTVASVITLTANPLSGSFVDRFGPRRVVIASQLLQAVGFTGFLFVRNMPTLIAFALLTTGGVRIFWASFPTWVAELAPGAGQRDRWFALTGAAQNAGLGLGGLIAGVMVGIGGHAVYRGLIAANAASFLIAAFVFLTQGQDRHVRRAAHEEGGYGDLLRDRPFVGFMVASTMYALCCTVITIALPIYVVEVLDLSGWVVGALFALNTAMLALGSPILIRWLVRYRRTRALLLASGVWVIASALLAMALEIPSSIVTVYIFAAVIIYSMGEMIFAPIATSLCSEAGPERLRGRYMATFSLGWGLAASLAPSFFTSLFSISGGAPWVAVALLSVTAAAIVLAVEPRLPPAAVRLRVGEPVAAASS